MNVKQETNDAEDFIEFMQEFVFHLESIDLHYLEDVIIILDGAMIHAASETRDDFLDIGVRVLMLPPYSPGK